MKKQASLFLLAALAALIFSPETLLADGVFVAPKFVWDKHKDINEPTQKAILVYDAGHEDMVLQVKYEGPVNEFGWLIPVPSLPEVKQGSMKCFYELSRWTQELEDPYVVAASLGPADRGTSKSGPELVKVIEIATVGAYNIAVLSVKNADALKNWLEANQFSIPPDNDGIIESYVKRQWYFIAVKINLGRSRFHATRHQLANGELHPLQIRFATDHCIFPLKISSLNGKPSEVQVYVFAREPFMERGMLGKKLPEFYTNDLAQANERAKQIEQRWLFNLNFNRRFAGGSETKAPPPTIAIQREIEKARETPLVGLGELPFYALVTKTDLPESSKWIPSLASQSWWLTKQTWTFQPEDMRDLEFEPAMSVYADLLGTRYGYFAGEGLAHLGTNAVPIMLAAFGDTNPVARVNAAAILTRLNGRIHDPRITDAAITWIHDSESEVRTAGVAMLTEGNFKPEYVDLLIPLLRDPDSDVRNYVSFGLSRYRKEIERYIPAFLEDLKDPATQGAAFRILSQMGAVVPREDLVRLLRSRDTDLLGRVFAQLTRQGENITCNETLALIEHPDPFGRQLGLQALEQNPGKDSVELALPLLRDPDEFIRLKTAQTLRSMTGQNFNEEQVDEWEKWWMQNRTSFIAQSNSDNSASPYEGLGYHVAGCRAYDLKDFSSALSEFRQACKFGSINEDYSVYRVWLIRARFGDRDAATRELADYLRQRKPQAVPDWPLQIGRFLAGQITEADLIKASANSYGETNAIQHCEAYFYAGSKRLIENDKTNAAELFHKCIDTKASTFEEYHSAEAELKYLN